MQNKITSFFIIKGFRTIAFILIVISTRFRPICPPAFFRCLSNSGTFTELRTTSFIETTRVACSDSVCHNRVHVLSIPVLLLACNLQMIVSLEAAGLGEIPPEVWKTREFDDILHRYCNDVYNQNTIDRWTKGCILPFPLKGDLRIVKNYQGITLTSIAAKIWHCRRCAAMGHICPIPVYYLLGQRASNVDWFNERKKQKQGADDTPHKLLRTLTTQRM